MQTTEKTESTETANFIVSLNDIKGYIEEATEISNSEKPELLKLLKTNITEESVDAMTQQFLEENAIHSMGGASIDRRSFAKGAIHGIGGGMSRTDGMPAMEIDWQIKKKDTTAIKKAIYRFLCTDTHENTRTALKTLFKEVLPVIAGRLSLPLAIVLKIATVILVPVLQEQKDKYCRINKGSLG